jgi:F-type H+-transporting ATPase subunit b
MKIDWFTIGAQVLNFLILVWLMKRFLYKPILAAIAAREKLIASELADAKSKKAEAQKEHTEFDLKNQQFDKQRADLLAKATADAKTEEQRLLAEARKSASDLSAKLQAKMEEDAIQLNQATQRKIENEVFSIARKALKDLAGANLDDLMVEAFIQRLKELSGEEKRTLSPSGHEKHSPSIITSAFNLSKVLQNKIEDALKQILVPFEPIKFETEPTLIGGIELMANGQKLAWSISGYLSALETFVETKKTAVPESAVKVGKHAA